MATTLPFDAPTTLLACAVGGFAFFASCTYVCKTLLTSLATDRRPFTASCITAFFNAAFVSPLSAYAAWIFLNTPAALNLECAPGVQNLITTPSSAHGIIAVGLTCGYFVADTMMLVLDPAQMKKDLGGTTQYMIMWMHHVVSLIVWPYSMLGGKAVFFVLYYMVTEVTNVGQNLYLILREYKSSLEMPVGVAWIASFFIVRVLPVPVLLYVYAKMFWLQSSTACGLPTPDLVLGMLTVPIPIGLNLMWFRMMVKKVQRMMAKLGKQ